MDDINVRGRKCLMYYKKTLFATKLYYKSEDFKPNGHNPSVPMGDSQGKNAKFFAFGWKQKSALDA
jgi:hypothetical protein